MSLFLIRTQAGLHLGAQACLPQACTGAVLAKLTPNIQAEAEKQPPRPMLPARNRVVKSDASFTFQN